MIEHIVLFRCKETCPATTKEAFIAAARTMIEHIPEIRYLSAGSNWSERGDGYELALVSRFENKTALETYQKHPYHQQFIAEWVKPNIDQVLAIDYFTT